MFNKIFNIGLPKTGTTSLHQALKELGFMSVHNPRPFRKQAAEGQYHFEPDDWRALNNFGEHCYPQLDQAYPNSKFILTVRDEQAWLASWQKQIGGTKGNEVSTRYAWAQPIRRLQAAVREALTGEIRFTHLHARLSIFGVYTFHAERCLYVYRLHRKNAVDYFKDRPNDFLIMDICAGDGWEQLCPFLEIATIPATPFPSRRPEKSPFADR
jgi:hypothetical protein